MYTVETTSLHTPNKKSQTHFFLTSHVLGQLELLRLFLFAQYQMSQEEEYVRDLKS